MKYAHLADSHLGSWRDDKMRDLSTKAFLQAIDDCINKQVDFIIMSGDLFNTSLPSLDILKTVTKKLKELKDKDIPLYAIPGSHDFSPSGKTMIDVLENAGLLINVCKGRVGPETKLQDSKNSEGLEISKKSQRLLNLNFVVDKKTGTKLTGMLGKKGMLDKTYYENLNLEPLEKEEGYKIFLFHTSLTELKPKHLEKMESQPLSFLPKNFNYYAGGHIHHKTQVNQENYGTFTYPGALFPNNFAELEKYSYGGYFLVEINNENYSEDNKNENKQDIVWVPINIIEHIPIDIDCSHKTPEVIAFDILNEVNKDLTNTLVTIRLKGKLDNGKISDIDFKKIFEQLYKQNAYFVMKNTAQLHSEEFEEIKIDTSSPEKIEEEIIKEHLQQIKMFDKETELQLTKDLLQSLNTEKKEGETISDFQKRIQEDTNSLLELEPKMN
ncbi:exonuclease SbcCD subunit D [Nanoarchaeota archaeon]